MKILFVGGTGNISRACSEAVLRLGYRVYHLNRGNRINETPKGVTTLRADINDTTQVRAVVENLHFDSIVDWIVFNENDAKRDLDLFSGLTDQYVFISSTSLYKKPAPSLPMTESTPLGNDYWQYSRDKIAAETIFWDAYKSYGFPITVVRPSHTYGDGWVPTPFGSAEFTIAQRMLDGKEVVVPGDGQSIWTLTHGSDFAKGFCGLLANRRAIGEAFHSTSNEILTWDAIYLNIGEALGVQTKILHIPSDYIVKRFPDWKGNLLGDKSNSSIFDNSKIKRFVPDFSCAIPFSVGIKNSIRRLQANPEKKVINTETEARMNALVKDFMVNNPGM